jgi:hypothetical protein
MLLQTQEQSPQASVTSRPTTRSSADTRRPVHRPCITLGEEVPARTASPRTVGDKWLVGLQIVTADRRCVRLYYVVDGALDLAQAVREGARRAHGELLELTAPTGSEFAGDLIEVRQLQQDALGRVDLAPSQA